MYCYINRLAHQLTTDLGQQDVETYQHLCDDLGPAVANPDAYQDYQGQYRDYWGMNAAGLTPAQFDAYFQFLADLAQQAQADNGQIPGLDDICETLTEICHQLHEMPNQQGRHCIYFSFATKLVHMVYPDYPIYDSKVKAFYFLPDPAGDFGPRMGTLLPSYRFLHREYNRILDDHLLDGAMALFANQLGDVGSPAKVIDWLIWTFVRALQQGAIRDGQVVYR